MAAFSIINWNRWGRHYVASLSQAHLLQQCNNFKDPGIQHYGGKLFQEQRDRIDKLFMTIPPPISKTRGSYNWQSFNSAGNPCFDGDCEVVLADRSLKKIKFIQKGDQILSFDNRVASVVCVIKTVQPTVCPLVTLPGGLKITPWHPIKTNGSWKFPKDLAVIELRHSHAVYSFVLDSEHTMVINGICCVTLGHGFTEPVVSHSYWGKNVIEDLKKEEGWESGKIVLRRELDLEKKSSSDFVNNMIALQKQAVVVN